jgi:hypothetical protein
MDVETLVKIIVIVVFIVIPALSQILMKLRQAQRPQPPGGGPPQAGGQRPVRSEVEEFLRRMAQPQAEQEAKPRRPAGKEPARRQPQRPAAGSKRRAAPVTAEVVQASSADEGQGRQAVGSRQLGREVAASDKRTQQRLRAVFDHQVGQLGEAEKGAPANAAAPSVDDRNTLAAQIVASLARPETIRQAVILSEILQRPEHRW